MTKRKILVFVGLVLVALAVVAATFQGGTNAKIINTTLTLAGTEYTINMPSIYHSFDIKIRSGGDAKCAFIATQSGTIYWTILSGATWSQDRIRLGADIFCQSATAGTIVETVVF